MLKLAVIFVLAYFVLGSPRSVNNSTFSGGKFSCGPYETECALGCCPIQDAVCCSDGYECCPPGSVCVPYIGVCIRLDSSSRKRELKSEATMAVQQNVSDCPAGTTTCPTGCCALPDAVCCSDKLHCCPNGYKCTPVSCVKSSKDSLLLRKIAFTGKKAFVSPQKTVMKVCPGGNHRCHKENNCCINDDGSWGCCDKPTLAKVSYECCNTYLGYACCFIPLLPHCTYFGCF